jgi:hypothetical protein
VAVVDVHVVAAVAMELAAGRAMAVAWVSLRRVVATEVMADSVTVASERHILVRAVAQVTPPPIAVLVQVAAYWV